MAHSPQVRPRHHAPFLALLPPARCPSPADQLSRQPRWVEARPGGSIVGIAADGTAYPWGTVTPYEPYTFVSMDFHIPIPDEQVTSRSLVEVRFTALGPERTRVRLTQNRREAFGERAKMLQGGYGQGWGVIFEEAFKAACSRGGHAGDEAGQVHQQR